MTEQETRLFLGIATLTVALLTTVVTTAGAVLLARVNRKQDAAAVKVEEVHKATNSLTDSLVAKAAELGLAQGAVEERARADAREKEARDQKGGKP